MGKTHKHTHISEIALILRQTGLFIVCFVDEWPINMNVPGMCLSLFTLKEREHFWSLLLLLLLLAHFKSSLTSYEAISMSLIFLWRVILTVPLYK